MIIYNVTIKVELAIHEEWLSWMKETHIPEVMATGCFQAFRFFRILQEDEQDGISYCVMYETDTITAYFDYQREHAPRLQQESKSRFGDKYLAFRTILRSVTDK